MIEDLGRGPILVVHRASFVRVLEICEGIRTIINYSGYMFALDKIMKGSLDV